MAKRKRRTFTPEYKAEVALEARRGGSSQAELGQRKTYFQPVLGGTAINCHDCSTTIGGID